MTKQFTKLTAQAALRLPVGSNIALPTPQTQATRKRLKALIHMGTMSAT